MKSAVQTAVETYVRASSERDPALRAALLETCFAEDGRIVSRSREIRGRAEIVAAFDRFLSDPELLGVRLLSAVDAQGKTFRFRAVADFRNGTSAEAFDTGEVDEAGKISVILTFAGPLAERPARGMNEDEVLSAEARLRRAMLASDVPELERLLAPELLFVTHLGQLISRDDDLAAHRSQLIRISSLQLVENQVRLCGDTATVVATVDIDGTFADQPASGRFRFLRVWGRRDDGQLQVIAGNATLLP